MFELQRKLGGNGMCLELREAGQCQVKFWLGEAGQSRGS